jgi:hypothetical protein
VARIVSIEWRPSQVVRPGACSPSAADAEAGIAIIRQASAIQAESGLIDRSMRGIW